jgi:hypothetical protein
MARHCVVCAREEFLPSINQRLREGESLASLSREFAISESSLRRHRARHLNSREPDATVTEQLNLLRQRLEELYKHAAATGQTRAALDALSKLTDIAESQSRMEVRQNTFEGLSLSEQTAWVRAHTDLYRSLLDSIVREFDSARKADIFPDSEYPLV